MTRLIFWDKVKDWNNFTAEKYIENTLNMNLKLLYPKKLSIIVSSFFQLLITAVTFEINQKLKYYRYFKKI